MTKKHKADIVSMVIKSIVFAFIIIAVSHLEWWGVAGFVAGAAYVLALDLEYYANE